MNLLNLYSSIILKNFKNLGLKSHLMKIILIIPNVNVIFLLNVVNILSFIFLKLKL